jgi:hypothetical protein
LILISREKSKKWAEQVAAAICIQLLKLQYDGRLTVESVPPPTTNGDGDAGKFQTQNSPLPYSSADSVNCVGPVSGCRGSKRPLSPTGNGDPDHMRCNNDSSIDDGMRALIDNVVAVVNADTGASNS